MTMMKCLGALSVLALAPCVAVGQDPAPPAPSSHHERASIPEANTVEMRRMVLARGALRALAPVAMRIAEQGMTMNAASMLLRCTGELQLSDAQVTKLAAIARRAETRENALRARLDSAVTRGRVGSTADGGGEEMTLVRLRLAAPLDAALKAQHEDDREALSIVTPDQLATAWEMMMARHQRAR